MRSSGFAVTPPGGHPSELMPEGFRPKWDLPPVMPLMPFSTTPEEAAAFVPQLLARGSDTRRTRSLPAALHRPFGHSLREERRSALDGSP